MAVKNYPIGTHFKGPIKQGSGSMLLSTDVGGLSAARTLTYDESNGQHYILDGGTGFAITLPAPVKGWSCKFTVGAAFTTDFVLTAQAAILEGSIVAGGIVIDVSGGTTINLAATIENVGDTIELWSDGTTIFVQGNQLTTLASVVA